MNTIILLRYFLMNVLYFNCVPRMIECYGDEWFSFSEKHEDNTWSISYSKFVNSSNMANLISVNSRWVYVAYLKMVHRLWKLRKTIVLHYDLSDCYKDIK